MTTIRDQKSEIREEIGSILLVDAIRTNNDESYYETLATTNKTIENLLELFTQSLDQNNQEWREKIKGLKVKLENKKILNGKSVRIDGDGNRSSDEEFRKIYYSTTNGERRCFNQSIDNLLKEETT